MLVASPDLTDLVDLTLFDKDPFDLIAQATIDLPLKFPGLKLSAVSLEQAMLEAFARITAENIYALNRIPGAVMDGLLKLYGITRSLGARPTAVVRFTLSDLLVHQVNAGTRVALVLGGTAPPLIFATDVNVVSVAGDGFVDAAVTALSNTALANGVAAGTVLTVVDAVAYVDAAVLNTSPAGGADEEAEADWRARAVNLFTSLRSTLVLPADFTKDALNWPGVFRATTIDDWDPTIPGAAIGHVTVAVLGEAGVFLSGAAKADLQAAMDAKAQANLAVHVVDPTVTAVDVSTTVHRLENFTAAQVGVNVTAALAAYLNTDAWPFAGTVRVNELLSIVDNVAGVDYVVAVTVPAADVVLAGAAPLAAAGSFAVTVDNP